MLLKEHLIQNIYQVPTLCQALCLLLSLLRCAGKKSSPVSVMLFKRKIPLEKPYIYQQLDDLEQKFY